MSFYSCHLLFTLLQDQANEWGGEAYSTLAQPSPPMGSGGYSYLDGYCARVATINEAHDPVDAVNRDLH